MTLSRKLQRAEVSEKTIRRVLGDLKNQGYSYAMIANRMGVGVSTPGNWHHRGKIQVDFWERLKELHREVMAKDGFSKEGLKAISGNGGSNGLGDFSTESMVLELNKRGWLVKISREATS